MKKHRIAALGMFLLSGTLAGSLCMGLLFPGTGMDEGPVLAEAGKHLRDPKVTERYPFLPRWTAGCKPDDEVGFDVTGTDMWGTPDELIVCCATTSDCRKR